MEDVHFELKAAVVLPPVQELIHSLNEPSDVTGETQVRFIYKRTEVKNSGGQKCILQEILFCLRQIFPENLFILHELPHIFEL